MSETSGDRHLREPRATRLGQLVAGPRRVLVVADRVTAATYAGQATLALLADLLARQFGVVTDLAFDIDGKVSCREVFVRTKPDVGTALSAALSEIALTASGGEIEVGDVVRPQVVVGVGRYPLVRGELLTIQVGATDTSAWCSTEAIAESTSGHLPFGAHLAACMAADRVFRAFHAMPVRPRVEIDLAPVLGSASENESQTEIVLPAGYLVGLGAVGAAVLYSLAAARSMRAELVGIDPDTAGITNRNRLLTMAHGDVDRPKVQLATELVANSNLTLYPNQSLWADYATDPGRQCPDHLRAIEPFRYEWILSAVDRNLGRRDIANVLPRHVLSGSTDEFIAQSAYYSIDGDCECLACNHPVPRFDLDLLRSEIAGLAPGPRLERLQSMGADASDVTSVEEYLADPSCGLIGETTLRRLGVGEATEWAVGHVSVAAGVLLAARWAALGSSQAHQSTVFPEARIFFGVDIALVTSQARRKSQCEICGSDTTRDAFRRRWLIGPNG